MTSKFKHLVTSGCSFTSAAGSSWPAPLAERLGLPLTNMGVGSAGNSWIAKAAIHAAQSLLDAGTSGEEILLIVMWSGIDRHDTFISSGESPDYNQLLAKSLGVANPVSFIDPDITITSVTDGYLLGTMGCQFGNDYVNSFKRELIGKFYTNESMAIKSYENFLRLQWYCQANRITLVNLTYLDLMHYPRYQFSDRRTIHPLTVDNYPRNVAPLSRMIDFTKWIFWQETGGLYEYTQDNSLQFNKDMFHPSQEAHAYYVDNFLKQRLEKFL